MMSDLKKKNGILSAVDKKKTIFNCLQVKPVKKNNNNNCRAFQINQVKGHML